MNTTYGTNFRLSPKTALIIGEVLVSFSRIAAKLNIHSLNRNLL